MSSIRKYLNGAFFLTLASLTSAINDACMKMGALTTSTLDILFLRFFFATLTLIPFILINKPKIEAKSIKNHAIRAIIFGISMFFFTTSLSKLPMAMVTATMFSIPVWVVLFACIFLKESWNGRLIAVLIGISGVIITCIPALQIVDTKYTFALLISAIGFATLDVFNKHLLNKDESMLMMLFGSSLGITLIYLFFFSFQIPDNILMYLYLGIGANLILYFILKAWQCCDVSALQPIKYIEFPISFYLGMSIFEDKTNIFIIIGVIVLLSGVILNMIKETKLKS